MIGRRLGIPAAAFAIALLAASVARAAPLNLPELPSLAELKDLGRIGTSFRLRMSANAQDNTFTLADGDLKDYNAYLGYFYELTVKGRPTDETTWTLLLENNGPGDYTQPLLSDGTFQSLQGERHPSRDFEFTPEVGALWLDMNPVSGLFEMRAGLHKFTVGNGFALGGGDENWGVTLALGPETLRFRGHIAQLDKNNEWYLGPDRRDEPRDNDANTRARLYAGEITTVTRLGHRLQLYGGVVADKTEAANRYNLATRGTNGSGRYTEDNLGTVGANLRFLWPRYSLELEAARNFGRAVSNKANGISSLDHRGYLLYGKAAYRWGLFRFHVDGTVASGNDVSEARLTEAAQSGFNRTTINSAFSVYSPSNANLADTHSQAIGGPFLAMGGALNLSSGLPRPGVFEDPSLWENVIALGAGLSVEPVEGFEVFVKLWHLRSQVAGFSGAPGSFVALPEDLGNELDLLLRWKLDERWSLDLLASWFVPGGYYEVVRGAPPGSPYEPTSTDNILGLSPNVRGDGQADPAWQIEVGTTWRF